VSGVGLLAIAGSLVLAGAHALTMPLERLSPRHGVWLGSLAGGVGLAYVCLYLLFELVTTGAGPIHAVLPIGDQPLQAFFVLLLSGLSTAYVLQMRLLKTPDPRDDHRGYASFFIFYNLLAGAGVAEEARWGALNLSFYVVALGLHLLFNDRFLLHLAAGAHTWRWRAALAAAPVLGCVLAVGLNPPESVLYGLLTLVAGGTIINVMRLELPAPENFHPKAFVAGVIGYAALILITWRL
jgi:hypothetical protein